MAISLVALVALLAGCSTSVPASAPVPAAPHLVPKASAAPTPEHRRATVAVPTARPPGVVDPPAGTGVQRYTGQALDWQPCLQSLRCATFRTPLEWSEPDGPAITVTMSRRPASGRSNGTVFVNPGGPGGSGLAMPRGLARTGLRSFDLIGWDPRGVGASTPVRCLDDAQTAAYLDLDTSPDDAGELRALERGNRRLGLSCLERSGSLADHVSTEDTVRDLELMRVLLRLPTVNLYGASYGTVIGSMYATLFPATSGRLVLDGAVVLGADEGQTQGFAAAFDAFAQWCAGHSCPLGDSPEAVVATTTGLLDRLDADPLVVGDRRLTQSLAVAGIVQWLYFDADAYPRLRDSLAAALDGDGRSLLTLADVANDRDGEGRYGQINAAFPAIRCLDAVDGGAAAAVADARRTARRIGGLAPYLGPDLVCPEWPVAARPVGRTLTGRGAPPILVIGTTGDPATPYALAQRLTRQLDGARLLSFDGVGHTAYGSSACVQRTVTTYLRDGTLPAAGTRC